MARRSRWRGVLWRSWALVIAAYALVASKPTGFTRTAAIFVIVCAVFDFGVHLLRPRWWGMDPDLERATNDAIKLEKKDPAAAAQREAREIATLTSRAASDRRAAQELVSRLEDKIGLYGSMRTRMQKNPERHTTFTRVLQDLEVRDAATRLELAEAETLLERARVLPQ